MNGKSMIIVGAVGAAVIAVAASAYVILKKPKPCQRGKTYKDVADFGVGNSSVSINKAGTSGTITMEKGFEIDLLKGVTPLTSVLPACLSPTKDVAYVFNDDDYETSAGVPNGSDGASWILRYYIPNTPGEGVSLYLFYSPANSDGTRSISHYYQAPENGKFKLLKPVNLNFQINPL